jgi:hypothetical protein
LVVFFPGRRADGLSRALFVTCHSLFIAPCQVNFNAGVVAAGEAIIESTVTGNAPAAKFTDKQARRFSRLRLTGRTDGNRQTD